MIDFGSADWHSELTREQVGTPMFRAPEMMLGKQYSFPVDYWGVGIIMYVLLSGGVEPFKSTRITALKTEVTTADPDYHIDIREQFSDATISLLKELLRRDPDHRA